MRTMFKTRWGRHCGHGAEHGGWSRYHAHHEGEGFMGGRFGVKRPLRYLAYKLELDEEQTGKLARILDELKTERAQAAVDERRTLSAFADSIAGENFQAERATEGAKLRKDGADRLADTVVKALTEIHAMLDDKQRERLAYLIRSGSLVL